MDVADHMWVGSITKSLTATVILQLAQEGTLALDAPLAPYFPEVDTNRATIRQALQLTSGIADYTTVPFLNALADDRGGSGRPTRSSPPSPVNRRCSRPAKAGTTRTRTSSCWA
jgi:CubicO group peptidase (beta-lactamase class C family)